VRIAILGLFGNHKSPAIIPFEHGERDYILSDGDLEHGLGSTAGVMAPAVGFTLEFCSASGDNAYQHFGGCGDGIHGLACRIESATGMLTGAK
jgi:hypothetical protein